MTNLGGLLYLFVVINLTFGNVIKVLEWRSIGLQSHVKLQSNDLILVVVQVHWAGIKREFLKFL